MKHLTHTLIIASLCFISYAQGQTVYTTASGTKYHKKNCRFLKDSKKETQAKKAQNRGYKACKVCKPDLYDRSKTTRPLKQQTQDTICNKPL